MGVTGRRDGDVHAGSWKHHIGLGGKTRWVVCFLLSVSLCDACNRGGEGKSRSV